MEITITAGRLTFPGGEIELFVPVAISTGRQGADDMRYEPLSAGARSHAECVHQLCYGLDLDADEQGVLVPRYIVDALKAHPDVEILASI